MSDFLGLLLARTARQLTAHSGHQGGLRLRPLSRFEAAAVSPAVATAVADAATEGPAPRPASRMVAGSAAVTGQRHTPSTTTTAAGEPRPQPQPAPLREPPPLAVRQPEMNASPELPVGAPEIAIARQPLLQADAEPLFPQARLGGEQPMPISVAMHQATAAGVVSPLSPPSPPSQLPSSTLRATPLASATEPVAPPLSAHAPLGLLQPGWANNPQPLPLPVEQPVATAVEPQPVSATVAPIINISIGQIELAGRSWAPAAAAVGGAPSRAEVQSLDAYLDGRSRHGRGERT